MSLIKMKESWTQEIQDKENEVFNKTGCPVFWTLSFCIFLGLEGALILGARFRVIVRYKCRRWLNLARRRLHLDRMWLNLARRRIYFSLFHRPYGIGDTRTEE